MNSHGPNRTFPDTFGTLGCLRIRPDVFGGFRKISDRFIGMSSSEKSFALEGVFNERSHFGWYKLPLSLPQVFKDREPSSSTHMWYALLCMVKWRFAKGHESLNHHAVGSEHGVRMEKLVSEYLESDEDKPTTCNFHRVTYADAKKKWLELLGSYGPLNVKNHQVPVEAHGKFADTLFEGKPGVITNLNDNWEAMRTWDAESLSRALRGYNLNTFNSVSPWLARAGTLHDYVSGKAGPGSFIFIDQSSAKGPDMLAMEKLKSATSPLPFFAFPSETNQSILAIDNLGTGHGVHHHGAVWQTQVVGRKAWFMFPPKFSKETIAKWTGLSLQKSIAVCPQCSELAGRSPCEWLKKKPPHSESCVIHSGETLVLPSKYWHATCGLDSNTMAMGGWLSPRDPASLGEFDDVKKVDDNAKALYLSNVPPEFRDIEKANDKAKALAEHSRASQFTENEVGESNEADELQSDPHKSDDPNARIKMDPSQQVFGQSDFDEDGFLSKQEMQKYLHQAGIHEMPWNNYDKDGDGRLSMKEWFNKPLQERLVSLSSDKFIKEMGDKLSTHSKPKHSGYENKHVADHKFTASGANQSFYGAENASPPEFAASGADTSFYGADNESPPEFAASGADTSLYAAENESPSDNKSSQQQYTVFKTVNLNPGKLIFEDADVNQDGFLSRSEMVKYLHSAGIHQLAWKQYDKNHDDKLSEQEFTKGQLLGKLAWLSSVSYRKRISDLLFKQAKAQFGQDGSASLIQLDEKDPSEDEGAPDALAPPPVEGDKESQERDEAAETAEPAEPAEPSQPEDLGHPSDIGAEAGDSSFSQGVPADSSLTPTEQDILHVTNAPPKKNMWDLADKNEDGVIDGEEFSKFLYEEGISVSAFEWQDWDVSHD